LSKPRILVDENMPKTAIQILRNFSFDVIPVWEIRPRLSDDDVVN